MPKSRKRKSGKLPKRAGSVATGLTGTPKVATLMEHGLEMFHQGDFESAEILFRQVLETSPDHAEAHNMIGVIGLSVGSPDLALGFFETAASIDDKNADYPMNQSIALLDLGEVDRAINAGKIAIDLRPRYAEAWNMLGVAFKAKEDWESARDAFAKTLDINPEYGEAWINLSGILQKLELPEEAIEAGEKGVAYCPQIPEAYYNLAGGFKDALRYSEAIETYGICVDLNPSYYDAHVNLSKCYIKIDEYEQAEKSAQRAIEIDPDFFYAYIFRAGILDQMDNRKQAISDYQLILKSKPDYYPIFSPLGVLLYLEEDWEGSILYFQKAYDFYQTDHFYALLISLSYLRQDDKKKMKDFMGKALVGFPRDSLYYKVGRLFLEPSGVQFIADDISREKNEDLKVQMLFVLATYYLVEGPTSLAERYYIEVVDNARDTSIEKRIAEGELARRLP